MDTPSYVYILASQRYGTLYIGVTSDLVKRVWEHRNEFFSGFTRQYNVKTLVWYETRPDIVAAIKREKQLKHWQRRWKIRLISQGNRSGAICMAISLGFRCYGSSPARG